MPLPASGGSRLSLNSDCVTLSSPGCALRVCLSVGLFCVSCVRTLVDEWRPPPPVIQDDLVISRLILSCKVLFLIFPPNDVTFTGRFQGSEVVISFGGGHYSTHYRQ